MQAMATYLENMESLSKLFHEEETTQQKQERITTLRSFFLCPLSEKVCGVCDKACNNKTVTIDCPSCSAVVHKSCCDGQLCNECFKLEVDDISENNGEPSKPPPRPTNTDPKQWITKPLRKALRCTFKALEKLLKEEEGGAGYFPVVHFKLFNTNLVESLFATLKAKTPKPTANQHMVNISRNLILWSIKQSNVISLPKKEFVGKTSAYTNLKAKTIGADLLQQLIKRHHARKPVDVIGGNLQNEIQRNK